MAQTRAADDFATIRARMEELRRERERAEGAGKGGPSPDRVRFDRVGQVAIVARRLRGAAG